jgi:hypothetical protein
MRLLKSCAIAAREIRDEGKALPSEFVVKPSNQPDFAKWLDLNMLVILPGRERTEEEFRALYAAAGFRLSRTIPAGGLSIIEGVPAWLKPLEEAVTLSL